MPESGGHPGTQALRLGWKRGASEVATSEGEPWRGKTGTLTGAGLVLSTIVLSAEH